MPSCGRDHAGSSHDKGRHHGRYMKGGVTGDLGVQPGNDREGDGIQDEGRATTSRRGCRHDVEKPGLF